MIYFAQAATTGLIKIGYSADVPGRLAELRLIYRTRLELLGVMDGDRRMESSLHARFNDLNRPVVACGQDAVEWFEPAESLLGFVSCYARPLSLPGGGVYSGTPDIDVESERRRPGRPYKAGEQKGQIFTMKGDGSYKEWLDDCAARRGVTTAEFVEQALAAAAAKWKLPAPPQR